MTLRIAGAASCPQDRVNSAAELSQSSELDYLVFSYLSPDVSRQLLLAQHENASDENASCGFVTQFVSAVRIAAPALYLQPQLKLLTNAGRLNPSACAASVADVLCQHGGTDLSIAVVRGDNLFDRLEELTQAGCPLDHVESGQPFTDLTWPIVGAHAHTGAAGHVAALERDARVAIGGSTAAEALTLAAVMHEFGYALSDVQQIAEAAAIGRIVAAGTFGTWDHDDRPPTAPGYPIAEFQRQLPPRITKNVRSEGAITAETVRRVLFGEPYPEPPISLTTPDVIIDLQQARYVARGEHCLVMEAVTGQVPLNQLDATIWYQRGYQACGLLWLEPANVDEQVELVRELVSQRMERAGCPCPRASYAKIGDRLVRWQVMDDHRETVAAFTDEIARLPREGPLGISILSHRGSDVRPAIHSWPTIVPQELLEIHVDCRPAKNWL